MKGVLMDLEKESALIKVDTGKSQELSDFVLDYWNFRNK